jgi:hypothetical protein
MPFHKSHTATKIRPHLGPEGLSQELVSQAKTDEGFVLFDDLTDGGFFSLEKGIFLFLIDIRTAAQHHESVVRSHFWNGSVPDFNNIE